MKNAKKLNATDQTCDLTSQETHAGQQAPHAFSSQMAGYQRGVHAQAVVSDTQTAVVYTDEVTAALRYMIEEEKMAGDIYDALYEQTGLDIFARIASSEDRHMNALIAQAERGGLELGDLTGLSAGKYANADLQSLYTNLLANAAASTEAALLVGQQIEQADITDLNLAMADVAGTQLEDVYGILLVGSQNHLAAFDLFLA